jgi:Mg2+ and Co2+ transporter CorA
MVQIIKIHQLLKSHRNELLTEKTINDIASELLYLLIDDITDDVMK